MTLNRSTKCRHLFISTRSWTRTGYPSVSQFIIPGTSERGKEAGNPLLRTDSIKSKHLLLHHLIIVKCHFHRQWGLKILPKAFRSFLSLLGRNVLNFFFPEKRVFPSEKSIAQSSSVAANSRESEKKKNWGQELLIFISEQNCFIETQSLAWWVVCAELRQVRVPVTVCRDLGYTLRLSCGAQPGEEWESGQSAFCISFSGLGYQLLMQNQKIICCLTRRLGGWYDKEAVWAGHIGIVAKSAQ